MTFQLYIIMWQRQHSPIKYLREKLNPRCLKSAAAYVALPYLLHRWESHASRWIFSAYNAVSQYTGAFWRSFLFAFRINCESTENAYRETECYWGMRSASTQRGSGQTGFLTAALTDAWPNSSFMHTTSSLCRHPPFLSSFKSKAWGNYDV